MRTGLAFNSSNNIAEITISIGNNKINRIIAAIGSILYLYFR